MVKKCLGELGFFIILEAKDVKSAQEILETELSSSGTVECVICDIHMPHASGLELVAWLRKHPQMGNMPVLMLTASQDKADVLNAVKLGITQYLLKPLQASVLQQRLDGAWRKHGQSFVTSNKKAPA